MFRLIPGTVSVALIACVVAAFVQAQEATRFWSAAGDASGRSARSPATRHEPTTVLVSGEAPASTALRSVLKRNATPAAVPASTAADDAASAPAPAASVSVSAGPATSKTAPPASTTDTAPPPPAQVAPAQVAPASSGGDAETALTGPSSFTAPRTLIDDDAGGPRVSSRRTQRPQVLGSTPVGVTAKPVPTQQADSAQNVAGSMPAASDPPTTLVKNMGPAIRVDVVGPTAAMLGEEAAFKVHVLNQGQADAAGVTVRIGVPDAARVVASEAGVGEARMQTDGGVTQVLWSLERLQAQAAGELTVKLVPAAERPIDLSVDWSIKPVVSTARIEVKQALLEMTLNGPDVIVYGDTKVFSIVLSNPGTGDARDVAVNVSLGPNTSDTMNVGTIPAGTSKNFDFEVTARQTGTMQIAATASGAGGLKQEAAHPVAVQRAELAVQSSGPEMGFAGSTATYAVRVANQGNAVARNVGVLVRIPQGVRYLQGEGNVRPEATGMFWHMGDLAPGTEREFHFDCEMTADGDAQFQVAARADGGVESAGGVTTRVESVADLTLTVNDPKGPIRVGQDVVYEISVFNRGNKAASQVNVVAQFSEGIEPVATDGMPGEIQTGQVIFQPLARINPKETMKLTVTAKALRNGNHVFRAAVQCSDPETRLVAEDTTQFYGGSPALHADSPAPASPSDRSQDAPRVGDRPTAEAGNPR